MTAPSSTPEAVAMRQLRERQRAALGLPNRIEAAHYIYSVTRTRRGKTGQVWESLHTEGRVQVDKKGHVLSRSVNLHGARSAYLACLNHVAEKLLLLYPEHMVAQKIQELLAAAPPEEAQP